MLFPCQKLSFLINFGGRKRGRKKKRKTERGKGDKEGEKGKGDKLVGRLKVTSSKVTMISGSA